MFQLDQTLKEFAESLKQCLSVVCNDKGEWSVEGPIKHFFRKLFLQDEKRKITLAKGVCHALDQIEKIPILFCHHVKTKQKVDFESYLQIIHLVEDQFCKCKSYQAKTALNELKRKALALKYRLESVNGGLEVVEIQQDLLNDLKKVTAAWKASQKIFYEKILTEKDVRKLAQASQYPEFAELLLQDEILLNKFLEWVIRDKNSVRPFVEFPAIHKKIVDSSLNGRIGRLGGEMLRVQKLKILGEDQLVEKVITLPFEGNEISLLNESRSIVFRGNYRLTIAQIFEIFKNKNLRVGNLELLSDGIINWNVHHLGWWDAETEIHQRIDLTMPKWWEQLPALEVLSKTQAQKRYGWHLDGETWNAAATASRGTPTLDFDKTHAYLEVAIPNSDGSYSIYDFGKFAFIFPSTFFENLSIFCHNVHATIAYPDENIYYSHRQHANHSFCMTEREGLKMMESIKKDMIKSRGKNFVFQIESDNCAKWVHEVIADALGDHRMPNLYKMPLLKTEPVGFIGKIFNFIKKLPDAMQTPVLTALHLPFGAAREIQVMEGNQLVLKSLTKHSFWETAEVYLPAFLHKQREEGILNETSANHLQGQVIDQRNAKLIREEILI